MTDEPVFTDPERDRELARDGFTVLRLLPEADAAAARERIDALLLARSREGALGACHISYTDPDPVYRKAMDALVRDILGAAFESAVQGYRIVSGGVFLKAPGGEAMRLHRDWTLTEDPGQLAFSLWCALEDVDAATGALHMVPGSHRLSDNIAGVGVPFYFADYAEAAKARSVPVPLRAGEAVAFDTRTLHWSSQNLGSGRRPAAQLVCVPASARHVYYVPDRKSGRRRFELFEIPDRASHDFTVSELAAGARPGPSLGFVENRNRPLPEESFLERLAARAS